MRNGVLAAALLVGLSCAATAEDRGGPLGTWLVENCSSPDPQSKTACHMWIAGFQSGVFSAAEGRKVGMSACLPIGFTGVQAVEVVEKFMRANPQFLQKRAPLAVYMALQSAFPCEKP